LFAKIWGGDIVDGSHGCAVQYFCFQSDFMAGVFKCPCGQQFKVDLPPGGAQVKCPGCGRLLKLGGGAAAPAQAPRQQPSPQAPLQQQPFAGQPAPQPAAADDPFAGLDVPASPGPSFGGAAPRAAAGSNPFPKKTGASSPAKSTSKSGNSKPVILAAAGVLVGMLVIVGVIAALKGNKNAGGPAAARGANAGTATAALAQSQKPVTEAEAKVVADKFEQEISKGSAFAANQMIPWQRVVELGLQGFDISETNKKQFATGAVNGLRQRNWAQIIKTQTGGDVKLLRMRTKDGSPTALYRAKNVDGGVGYFEFSFYRDPSDNVRISDIYVFQTGEWMSGTINRAAIPFIAHLNRSFLQKLSGAQNDYVKHHKEIEQMGRMAQLSPQTAMNSYRSLPASLKGDKTVMILRIGIASQMNNESEYQSAINDFMQKFPNDPAAQLFAIDYYAMKNDMNSTMTAIQKLDNLVGGDPALQVLEATVSIQQGNVPQAKSALQKALQRDPEYAEAQEMLANLP
jgi:tetratricopeptide (TPR) repeat protein